MQIAVGDIVEIKWKIEKRMHFVPGGRQGMVIKVLPDPAWLRVQAAAERTDGKPTNHLMNFDVLASNVILKHRQRMLEEEVIK